MSPYLVLLILEFFPPTATLPYGLDSNVTQLLANLLTKPSVFYYLPIVPCNLVSIKLLLLLLVLRELSSTQNIRNILIISINYLQNKIFTQKYIAATSIMIFDKKII